jgi:hypothetical protein
VSALWTAGEAAQVDYEQLRQATLEGVALLGVAAQRFTRRGLAGLIAWPAAEPVFDATLIGAVRPAWTPHTDPRAEALADAYALLLTVDPGGAAGLRKVR